jgi:hypothetical protein
VNPGAHIGAPGFHDVMKNENVSERAAALVNEALDVLQRAEHAPDSPVNTFLTAEMRRKMRRAARHLRERRAEPRYKNLHTAEELADIYERTIQRDEILEMGMKDFKRITLDLRQVFREDGPEVEKTVGRLIKEMARSAEEQGPGSEAALRYQLFRFLGWFGQLAHDHRRKPHAPFPYKVSLARDPSVEARYQASGAEVLDTPPSSGEAVIAFPPEERDSGRDRIFIRIGIGEASWLGSFETGHMNVCTISMMPDHKHLFVSAEGAGYIIDLKSRTLVEEIGLDVARVLVDEQGTLFIVDHNGSSLEAFGRSGRLWKTDPIGCGGFRDTALTNTRLIGEARQASPPGWAGFSVKLATGEVRFPDAL